MAESVLTAVYRRLDTCPWVRPDAVARGRLCLSTRPLPTAEDVARSMLEWVLGVSTA